MLLAALGSDGAPRFTQPWTESESFLVESKMSELVQQIIDDRYIDRNKLMLLLSQKFPAGSSSAEVFLSPHENNLPPNAFGIVETQQMDHHRSSGVDGGMSSHPLPFLCRSSEAKTCEIVFLISRSWRSRVSRSESHLPNGA